MRESTRGRKWWEKNRWKDEGERMKRKDVSIGVNAIEVLLKKASTLQSE